MTTDEFLLTVGEITYKPQHRLFYSEIADDVWKISWAFRRPDCYNPDDVRWSESGYVLVHLESLDREGLVRTIFSMTKALEEHEAREWFLFKGERPFDPHKELVS